MSWGAAVPCIATWATSQLKVVEPPGFSFQIVNTNMDELSPWARRRSALLTWQHIDHFCTSVAISCGGSTLQKYGLGIDEMHILECRNRICHVIWLAIRMWMCRALMPGDEESMSDEAIWETLPHFWVAISMVFFIAATIFTLLKLCGDVLALGWWDLFINYGIAECFAFLVCTKWYNPAIHRDSHIGESGSSMTIGDIDWNRGLVVSSDENRHQNSRICNLQDIGGHFMKIPFIGFQIMLFMHLEGTPPGAKNIPFPVLFSPLFLVQGAGVLFAAYRLVEKFVILLRGGASSSINFSIVSKAHDFLGFLHHGSRLLGWWSIDEGSKEEQARLYYAGGSGYNTFSPDTVKRMPKSALVEEIWRLQAALGEQTEITKFSQQECERLQNEKILCRVCFVEQINVVLLPCRHHVLCSTCCEKCKKCPICRVVIEERLDVYDV
ncbi:hypothetical protein GH714_009735 [Hevea brasiliensis]|uniref:RING-type domain-containing protein n=1 Tax=Hevea brasiliensis TaxID=3981 RepID=A0A6A6MDV4_HEVBR|nr:hypothetical protein GH714_009735 [Hevea brasiliensis]